MAQVRNLFNPTLPITWSITKIRETKNQNTKETRSQLPSLKLALPEELHAHRHSHGHDPSR